MELNLSAGRRYCILVLVSREKGGVLWIPGEQDWIGNSCPLVGRIYSSLDYHSLDDIENSTPDKDCRNSDHLLLHKNLHTGQGFLYC